MKRFLLIILSFIIYQLAFSVCAIAQGYFGEAQWIGAITREVAKIPEGRHYSGNAIKKTKAEWDKAEPLSRRSIILRRSFKPYKTVKHAELRICGLGFYEATINGQKLGLQSLHLLGAIMTRPCFSMYTMSPSRFSKATMSYAYYWVMVFIMNKAEDTSN